LHHESAGATVQSSWPKVSSAATRYFALRSKVSLAMNGAYNPCTFKKKLRETRKKLTELVAQDAGLPTTATFEQIKEQMESTLKASGNDPNDHLASFSELLIRSYDFYGNWWWILI